MVGVYSYLFFDFIIMIFKISCFKMNPNYEIISLLAYECPKQT